MRSYIKICGLLLGVLLCATTFFVGAEEPTAAEPTGILQKERITRLLLLGCDRASGLADSILLVSINEEEKSASVLQIPRDTYAEYTERDYKKINGTLSVLGTSGAKDFFSSALGVEIHHFAVIDLDLFCKTVDAVGGVDVEVPLAMEYHDPAQNLHIMLGEGVQHLDGKAAEQFVRYRAGYADADLGRINAQRIFLRAFVKKCNTLSAKEKIELAFSVLTSVQTDIDLPSLVRMTAILGSLDADAIPMVTIPGQAVQGTSGAWYYSINRQGAIRVLNQDLLPQNEFDDRTFDPNGVFDREELGDFHNIYIAPEEKLPLG